MNLEESQAARRKIQEDLRKRLQQIKESGIDAIPDDIQKLLADVDKKLSQEPAILKTIESLEKKFDKEPPIVKAIERLEKKVDVNLATIPARRFDKAIEKINDRVIQSTGSRKPYNATLPKDLDGLLNGKKAETEQIKQAEILVKRINEEDRVQLTALQRLFSGLNAASPSQAIINLTKSKGRKPSDIVDVLGVMLGAYNKRGDAPIMVDFARQYGASMKNALGGFFTGRAKTPEMFSKYMGMAGLPLDILLDPTTFGVGPVSVMAKAGAGTVKDIGATIKALTPKGVQDTIGRKFDLFHDFRKLPHFDDFYEAYMKAVGDGKVGEFLSRSKNRYPDLFFEQVKGSMRGQQGLWRLENEAKNPNKFLQTFDKLQSFWKGSVTGWFPSFHTRNLTDSMQKNIVAGMTDQSLYNTAKNIRAGKDGFLDLPAYGRMSYQDILKQMQSWGVVGQAGIIDVAKGIPAKAMRAVEDFVRSPLFLDRLMKGDKFSEAAKAVQKTHYEYRPEFFTKFEKDVMMRVFPFYKYEKGNINYWSDAWKTQSQQMSWFAKGQQGTAGNMEERPFWRRQMYSLGQWGGFGGSYEDFGKLLENPINTLVNKLTPLILKPVEAVTGYSFFKGKMISEDTNARNYANSPNWMKSFIRFKDGQADPWRKWLLETGLQRGLSTYLGQTNANDAIDYMKLFTSIQPDRYTSADLAHMAASETRNRRKSFWDYVLPSAWTSDPSLVAKNEVYRRNGMQITGEQMRSFVGANKGAKGEDALDIAYRRDWSRENDRRAYIDSVTKQAGRILDVNIAGMNPGLAKEQAKLNAQEIKIMTEGKKQGWDPAFTQQAIDAERAKFDRTKPRLLGSPAPLSPADMIYRPWQGNRDDAAWYESNQEKYNQRFSKTSEILVAGLEGTAKAIAEARKETEALNLDVKSSGVSWTPEQIAARRTAIAQKLANELSKIEQDIQKTTAKTAQITVEGMAEGVDKLLAQAKADTMEFEASDDARRLRKEGKEKEYNARLLAIGAKYSQKIKERQLAEAESTVQTTEAVMRDQIRAAEANLKTLFDQGYLSLARYYEQQRQLIREKFRAMIEDAQKTLAVAEAGGNKLDIDKAKKRLGQLTADQGTMISGVDQAEWKAREQANAREYETKLWLEKTKQATYAGFNPPADWRQKEVASIMAAFDLETDKNISDRTNAIPGINSYNAIDSDAVNEMSEEDLEAYRKIDEEKARIDEYAKERMLQRNQLERQETQKNQQLILNGSASMLGDTANMWATFYEATGKKHKEFFVLMKAFNIAETLITGISASMEAYKNAQKIPYIGMSLAPVWAGIVMATTMAKVSLIASQSFAEGGLVEGPRTAEKDKVKANVTPGEYVQQRAAVDYYGVSVMEAMNRRMIDPRIFSVPNLPVTRGAHHFASGGLVTESGESIGERGETSLAIYNILDPHLMGQYMASNPGQRSMLNFISQNRNVIKMVLTK